ncbi:hypothetical protein DFH06DRAFT_1471264 [Mycena polygramma]|nr:hypothetical protein DFH06DRAFT_1471264 [Mycena polygramma]
MSSLALPRVSPGAVWPCPKKTRSSSCTRDAGGGTLRVDGRVGRRSYGYGLFCTRFPLGLYFFSGLLASFIIGAFSFASAYPTNTHDHDHLTSTSILRPSHFFWGFRSSRFRYRVYIFGQRACSIHTRSRHNQ